MKAFKKNVIIEHEKRSAWKLAYYQFDDGEVYFIMKYSVGYTNKEIKSDVVQLVEEHF